MKNEDIEQILLVKEIKKIYPDVIVMMIPNGMTNNKKDIALAKKMGLLEGAPDLMLFYDGMTLLLELKTSVGVKSKTQIATHQLFMKQGFTVHTAYSFKEAMTIIEEWWNN